jgi:hypothetical protein
MRLEKWLAFDSGYLLHLLTAEAGTSPPRRVPALTVATKCKADIAEYAQKRR